MLTFNTHNKVYNSSEQAFMFMESHYWDIKLELKMFSMR